MRVLIIKTSSLGDVIHTLPAITDAAKALPDIRFDWVVEEGFSEVPGWHPAVDRVIPVALRRWRKAPMNTDHRNEWRAFLNRVRERKYDLIIDAQGLMKSAWLARKAHGPRVGLSWSSAREPLASLAYARKIRVSWEQHAVSRVRALFSAALGYPITSGIVDYGIERERQERDATDRRVLFLHGTTWPTKHYPESYWIELAQHAAADGYRILLPWGNDDEQARAQRIAEAIAQAEVLPNLNLDGVAAEMAGVDAVVSVDTGLSHLAAAMNVPQICLYGPTDPGRTGSVGAGQLHLYAIRDCAPCLKRQCRMAGRGIADPPCFDDNAPPRVWEKMRALIAPHTG